MATAEEIIKLSEREKDKDFNFLNLYQEVADLMMPRENEIVSLAVPGQDKSKTIFDPTAMLDLQDMVSGLSAAFFPEGQLAFGVTAKDRRIGEIDRVKRYLALVTQIAHDEILNNSNFMLQLNETLCSLVGFGTGNLFSEWDSKRLGLNYKDWDVCFYSFLENCMGLVDGMILRFPLTARQAAEKFGDNAGKEVLEKADDLKTEANKYDFITVVRARVKRNVMLTDIKNMPFESVTVNKKEKLIVDEGGYEEFPFAVPRWLKGSSEKHGRGQGTYVLSAVKELQQMHRDLVELGNKYNNPPKEVLDHFEGTVDVRPGALNFVREKGTIRGLDQTVLGNFPINADIIKMQQEISHRAFFSDVFAPLAHLTGDRRTQLEIMERVKQAMKKLALPVYRLRKELFEPNLTRSILLLIRNGKIPTPDRYGVPELAGKSFGLKFLGELALSMRDQQARAFTQFAGLVSTLDPVFPGAKDIINIERSMPDIAATFGVKVEHLNTPEEIEAKQQERATMQAAMMAAQAAQVASKGYKDTTKAPEEGSLADAFTR